MTTKSTRRRRPKAMARLKVNVTVGGTEPTAHAQPSNAAMRTPAARLDAPAPARPGASPLAVIAAALGVEAPMSKLAPVGPSEVSNGSGIDLAAWEPGATRCH